MGRSLRLLAAFFAVSLPPWWSPRVNARHSSRLGKATARHAQLQLLATLFSSDVRATSGRDLLPNAASPDTRLSPHAVAPVIVAASAFGFADVATKVTLNAQADVLTMALFRGLIGVPLLLAWLLVGATPNAADRAGAAQPLARSSACCSPATSSSCSRRSRRWRCRVAILTYFTYPLLTGLAAAATGIERLGLAGVARGARRLLRARADDRRASRRRRAHRHRLRARCRHRTRVVILLHHPRQARRAPTPG